MYINRWLLGKVGLLVWLAIVPWLLRNTNQSSTTTILDMIGDLFMPMVFMSFVVPFFLHKSSKPLKRTDLSRVWLANPLGRDLGLLPAFHLAAWGNFIAGLNGLLQPMILRGTMDPGISFFGLGTAIGIIIGIRWAIHSGGWAPTEKGSCEKE